MNREDWIWYIVASTDGNGFEVFNSRCGAEEWTEKWGGIVIPVKEAKNDT